MGDILLLHGTIVTMNADREVIEDGAVLVEDTQIVGVGAAADYAHISAERTIDCSGRVIIPGLIDAHGHGGHSLIKTLASDTPALWMSIVTPAYFEYTTTDYWYADGLTGALERLRAGVTCAVSVIGSVPRSDDPSLASAQARAYGEVGLRGVVAVGPCGPPWPHSASTWSNGTRTQREFTLDDALAGTEAVLDTCHGMADGRIRVFVTPFTIVPSLNPSAPTTPDLATSLTDLDRVQARRVRQLARKWRTRIHSDAFGGMVRLAATDDQDPLLGPDVHLQHCIGIAPDEVEILARTETHVGQAPIPYRLPILALMGRGVNVAITSDGSSRRPFDLLQAARTMQFGQQISEQDGYLLPAGKLLEMITIDAARALGADEELGSVEAGKKADLAILNLRQPHLVPNWMVVHRLIYEATGHDVETVLVDGRIVMENHTVASVDTESVLGFAEEQAWALVKRAGLESHLTDPGWGQLRRTFAEPVIVPQRVV